MGSPILKNVKIRELLARNLRAMLEVKDWSENELARRSGVSQKQVNNICMSRTGCGIDALEAISRALAIEPWQLLTQDFSKSVEVPTRAARFLHAYMNMDRKQQVAIEAMILPNKRK